MRFLVVLIIALAAALPAQAQNSFSSSNGVTIHQVLKMLAAAGYPGEHAGGNAALVPAGDANFAVEGYNCSTDGKCTEFLFAIGYDLPNGFPLQKINAWNASIFAGRAFLDDEYDPWIDHIFSITGPEDADVFNEAFELWLAIVGEFEKYIDGGPLPIS